MTANQFLSLRLPNPPYCEFSHNRGPSTTYSESFHIENKGIKRKLNIYFDKFQSEVAITLFDGKLREQDKFREVYHEPTINEQIIAQICDKYLR